jgi:hypothetical protein
MTMAEDGSSARRKRRGLWRLLILTLLFCAGAVYLERQGFDWKNDPAAPQERPSASLPVKRADLPTKPSALTPNFDIAYADETGKLVAAGRGEAGWVIRLSSNTQTLGETKAGEDGEWVLIPEQPLASGEHILSLLAIDPVSQRSVSGQRSITVSIALRRENVRQAGTERTIQVPAAAGPAPASTQMTAGTASPSNDGQNDCGVVVVKPGDTLWQMAQHCYGDGTKYSIIFQSNRQRIQNPNLIYADQQFSLPH